MIEESSTGYRTIAKGYDLIRWQHLLFARIRESPLYKSIMQNISDQDNETIEHAVKALRLTREGKPCHWAVSFMRDDLRGDFDPTRTPPAMSRGSQRIVSISASPVSLNVETYKGWNPRTDRVKQVSKRPDTPMQVAATDWERLECVAIEAARQAVQEMRENFDRPSGSPYHDRHRVKAGNESKKTIQIERLALRLTGRTKPGELQTVKVDRDWCADLGIDALRVT
jgi:hypothetical protein